MFRRLLLALFASVLLVGPVAAEDVNAADRAAITAAIRAQLDAFRRNDAAGAFRQAAPAIQTMFGTPDSFMAMVKGAYSPVYRAKNVEFGLLTMVEGVPVQRVRMDGTEGRRVLALYSMEPMPEGGWRIAGCVLVEDDDKTA